MPQRVDRTLLIALFILALALRLYQLGSVPPGWRDDELINSLVISQRVLDGDWRVYYADASGHEGLYHILNAGFLALFGVTPAGIRWLSALLGAWTVVWTYRLGKEMFGRREFGLIAALALSVSFWSLMYSRTGIRHIALPAFVLPAIFYFWRTLFHNPDSLESDATGFWPRWRWPLLAALWLGLSFYTYFASRGTPLILIAFLIYLTVVDFKRVRRKALEIAVLLGGALLLALPLIVTLQQQPESEARVAELAVPITAARDGDFGPLIEYTRITLAMFHATGDSEFLYNIPDRPVFGPLGATFFWLGVAIAFFQTVHHLLSHFLTQRGKSSQGDGETHRFLSFILHPSSFAFLLLWWLAGISPGFLSVPPASLGHTILAQPAVYLLAASAVVALADLISGRSPLKHNRRLAQAIPIVLAMLFILPLGYRDLRDYFVVWPERGQTRFLYRAPQHDLADHLSVSGQQAIAIASTLNGPWDKVAFEAYQSPESDKATVNARWFNPERAIFIRPNLSAIGYPRTLLPFDPALYQDAPTASAGPVGSHPDRFKLASTTLAWPAAAEPHCFVNGLCLWPLPLTESEGVTLELFVQVDQPLDLAPFQLISNPPPPGTYAGRRLLVFAQLLDPDGSFLTGDDGLWVDEYSLREGDQFMQQHRLSTTAGLDGATIAFGLYDPMTGERVLTLDGRDHIAVTLK